MLGSFLGGSKDGNDSYMKDSIKNFLAMVFATVVYLLAFSVIFSIYYLFEAGPTKDEFILMFILVSIFGICVKIANSNKRMQTALEYPFLHNL